MKRFLVVFLELLLVASFNLFSIGRDSNPLPPQYKKWLDEEIVYIITPKEKAVFLQLKTDNDRDLFIEAFWKQRNPSPTKERNEFKDEHYKRIEYANRNFGEAAIPGWKTDRGRIYIILGRPNSVQTYEGASSLYPIIVWFYQEMGQHGLPDAFYVVFFKRYGAGDYKLYSPSIDGPQSLLANAAAGQTDYPSAYRELVSIDPNLAKISLSLVPSEPSFDSSPSLSSDKLLFDISSYPQKKVRDEYAEKMLLYKDKIEVEYSANYIDNNSLVKITRDDSGIFFVNYLISIPSLSLISKDNKYFTSLLVNGNVTEPGGNSVFQFERTIPLELGPERFAEVKSKGFAFQDMFPLVEGNYHFSLLLKNEASKEFTSLEKNIYVPNAAQLQISPLILAFKLDKSTVPDSNQPFKIGEDLLFPSIQSAFSTGDPLFLFFQIYGLPEEQKEKYFVGVSVFKEDKTFKSFTKKVAEYGTASFYLEKFSLSAFSPANYRIRVSLLDQEMKEMIFEEEYFYISYAAALPRPWLHSSIISSSLDPRYYNILGEQYIKKNDVDRAKPLLEKAYLKDPHSVQFALSYSQVLLRQKDFHSIIKILAPFQNEKNNEIIELLGRSHHALGELTEAVTYYKDYISRFGVNYTILTLLGDCYYREGNKEEAIKAWEKSLELNSNQDTIKKLVQTLKREKSK